MRAGKEFLWTEHVYALNLRNVPLLPPQDITKSVLAPHTPKYFFIKPLPSYTLVSDFIKDHGM